MSDVSPVAPRTRLRELGQRPRKRLSQSFLVDEQLARGIVAAADLDGEHDDVLEVGPGLGILTRWLVERARRVVAVELDSTLAAALPAAVPAANLEVLNGDILAFQPASAFEHNYAVVANLPYHVTSPALRHLLAAGPPFASRLVVMVQREVAQRMIAEPGQLSALAVVTRAQARVRLVRHVRAAAFYPAPKVDSTVLRLDVLPRDQRPVSRADLPAFEAFVHAGFAQPRKTLLNSLAQGLGASRLGLHGEPNGRAGGKQLDGVVPPTPCPSRQREGDATPWTWKHSGASRERVARLLALAGLDPERRPQTLSVTDWAALFQAAQASEAENS